MGPQRFAFLLLLFIAVSCRDKNPTQPDFAAEIHISSPLDTLSVGDSVRLQVSVLNSNGSLMPSASVQWSSSDSLVAAPKSDGWVIAQLPGTASITARSGGVSATVTLVITGPLFLSCRKTGVVHAGIIGTETWKAAESPHHIPADGVIIQGQVTLEPGVLVCGVGAITVKGAGSQLVAVGTTKDPVILTSADPAGRWRGITIDAGSTRIANARIENADTAVRAYTCAEVIADSVHVRQSGAGIGGNQPCPVSVKRSVFDTIATRAIWSQPTPADSKWQTSSLHATAEDNVIRHAGLGIAFIGWNGDVVVSGGRIEDSEGGIAIISGNPRHLADDLPVTSARPVRVVHTGSAIGMRWSPGLGEYGAVFTGTVRGFASIWPRAQDRDSLRGNLQDTLLLSGGFNGELLITKQNPVRHVVIIPASADIPWTGAIERVRLDAGASLSTYVDIGTLIVNGTASEPATIAGVVNIGCAEGNSRSVCLRVSRDTSYLRHLNVIAAPAWFASSTPVVADSITVQPSYGPYSLSFGAGSVIRHAILEGAFDVALGSDTRIDDSTIRGNYGDGVAIWGSSNVVLSNCTIVDNGGSGVYVHRGSNITIHDCNIERNGGVAVANETASRIDAQRNWWGDPGGPLGPLGGGLLGDVDYSNYRSVPVSAAHNVASAVLTPASASVATSDTARFRPEARDVDGHTIPGERFICRVDDPQVATCDVREGVVVGLRLGSTTVRFLAASDTTVQATGTLDVTVGAPSFTWTRYSQYIGYRFAGLTLWAASAQELFLAGSGIMARFDGFTWRPVPFEAGWSWQQLAGTATSSLVGVAQRDSAGVTDNAVFEFDGAAWHRMTAPTQTPFRVSAASDGSLVIGGRTSKWPWQGDSLYIRSAGAWHSVPLAIMPWHVWHHSPDDVYVADDSLVLHWNGSGWTRYAAPIGIVDVWDEGSAAYIVGNGEVMRFTSGRWESTGLQLTAGVSRIHGSASNDMFVAGTNGLLRHFDGNVWRTVWSGTTESLRDVWVTPTDVFLLGYSGIVYQGRRN